MAAALLRWALSLAIAAIVGLASPSYAQRTGEANPGGGVFIAIDDGQPRTCVNITKSLVSVFVISVKARQNTTWLPSWIVASWDVGVKINLTLIDPSSQDPTFTFPRAVKLRPSADSNIVVLPIIFRVLTKYDLVQASKSSAQPLSNLSLDLDFINIEAKTSLATAMGSLIEFSTTLPVPPNPFTTGVQFFGKFANALISQAADGAGQDRSPVAATSYDLSTTDTCRRRELTEGTTGVIFDYAGSNTDGVIATTSARNYCFAMDENNAVTFFAKPQPALDCARQTGTDQVPKQQLNNPQIVFTVNAYPRGSLPAAASSARIANRALARCDRAGIPSGQCI